MPSIVTMRFVACHDKLKEEGVIRSSRQFALKLEYRAQNLNEILKGNRDAPLELIRQAVEVYQFNPLYLYSGEGTMFLHSGSHELRIVTVVTDREGQERIIHVPVPAQAGYSQEQIDPVFYQELPAYNLPDKKYQSGTFRSFDVAGDSMEPTLFEGDKVICRFVDPSDWLSGIRDHHVYVIVTRTHVMVKRVLNNLFKHRHLELLSDNDFYRNTRVNVGDIKELWHIHAKISHFSHTRNNPSAVNDGESSEKFQETIREQSQTISQLTQTLSQMLVKQ
ncbi:MAG: S24 family peptidase [Saprospiraceae bacterium]|nr:S24 family peptidase [Saprospiraceae bacterium]